MTDHQQHTNICASNWDEHTHIVVMHRAQTWISVLLITNELQIKNISEIPASQNVARVMSYTLCSFVNWVLRPKSLFRPEQQYELLL